MVKRFFTDLDRYYFHHGVHYELYNKMGAHVVEENGVRGVHFVLWAPSARAVCVASTGNGWDALARRDGEGGRLHLGTVRARNVRGREV